MRSTVFACAKALAAANAEQARSVAAAARRSTREAFMRVLESSCMTWAPCADRSIEALPKHGSPATPAKIIGSGPLCVRETCQRGERGGEARPLARRERLAQEKETEQGRHDETHLRDRDHHARLRALHALDHESEGEGENDR